MQQSPDIQNKSGLHTLVVGASTNPERYSHRATLSLLRNGHPVTLYGSRKGQVNGMAILTEWPVGGDFHTVTMYVGPQNQVGLIDGILSLKPKRVIFNPGTENPEFYSRLQASGIEHEEACTLVLLGTGQF